MLRCGISSAATALRLSVNRQVRGPAVPTPSEKLKAVHLLSIAPGAFKKQLFALVSTVRQNAARDTGLAQGQWGACSSTGSIRMGCGRASPAPGHRRRGHMQKRHCGGGPRVPQLGTCARGRLTQRRKQLRRPDTVRGLNVGGLATPGCIHRGGLLVQVSAQSVACKTCEGTFALLGPVCTARYGPTFISCSPGCSLRSSVGGTCTVIGPATPAAMASALAPATPAASDPAPPLPPPPPPHSLTHSLILTQRQPAAKR